MLEKIKRSRKALILLLLLAALLLWIFFPRNLMRLADIREDETISVTVHRLFIPGEEPHIARELSEGEAAQFFAILKSTYVFRAPFTSKLSSADESYVGCLFETVRAESAEDGVPPLLGCFKKNIVSIDGVRYYVYGNDLTEWLEAL